MTSKNLFAKPKRKRVQVAVPECDGVVFIQELGAKQLNDIRNCHKDDTAKADAFFDFEFHILACCLCDEDGNLLFADADDLRNNSDMSVDLLRRLSEEALKVSGLSVPKN